MQALGSFLFVGVNPIDLPFSPAKVFTDISFITALFVEVPEGQPIHQNTAHG
jgi:hypothetical protein